MRIIGFAFAPFMILACSSDAPVSSSSSSSSGGSSSGGSSSGGSSSGQTSGAKVLELGGTFNKLTLTPTDGIGLISHDIDTDAKAAGVKTSFTALISDRSGLCGKGANRQNGTVFFIEALSEKDTLEPGEFTQHNDSVPGQVDLGISKLDAMCKADGTDYGTATGKVTITSVTATAVAGTFDVTLLNDAGTLTGSFNVPLCADLGSDSCAP